VLQEWVARPVVQAVRPQQVISAVEEVRERPK
jgi:hypothetical protein